MLENHSISVQKLNQLSELLVLLLQSIAEYVQPEKELSTIREIDTSHFNSIAINSGNTLEKWQQIQSIVKKVTQDFPAALKELTLDLSAITDAKNIEAFDVDNFQRSILQNLSGNPSLLRSQIEATQTAQEKSEQDFFKTIDSLVSEYDGERKTVSALQKHLAESNMTFVKLIINKQSDLDNIILATMQSQEMGITQDTAEAYWAQNQLITTCIISIQEKGYLTAKLSCQATQSISKTYDLLCNACLDEPMPENVCYTNLNDEKDVLIAISEWIVDTIAFLEEQAKLLVQIQQGSTVQPKPLQKNSIREVARDLAFEIQKRTVQKQQEEIARMKNMIETLERQVQTLEKTPVTITPPHSPKVGRVNPLTPPSKLPSPLQNKFFKASQLPQRSTQIYTTTTTIK